ncbi:Ribosomal protein S18 acetylase RimI [Microbacterium sp. cf046]|uniref:GNAT family N-acetyltransferase n=1 Tax=Microbacterium sp. cf046 TaxID=1761803 RepID=UPI0008F2DEE5|nr:GNAT family N-acetyltransferase [Microbacterium sp. cf046]SFS16104.1 Ribosomal protein S18 acetylase RimI [Microbacterium sp. cf046]
MTATVRVATRDDTRAIATVRIESWRAGYDGLIAREVLDRMDVEHEARRRGELWDQYHSDPRSVELLAEVDGDLAGWAAVGPSIDEDLPDDGQVYAIYALPRFWSAGVGHALMTDAETRLVAAGFDRAHLWVLEGNERAAAFYERHGWREDGAIQDDDQLIRGDHPQTLRERRRVRDLREDLGRRAAN